MEKIVIIAFSEEGSREYFTSCIKKSVPGVQVFDGSDDKHGMVDPSLCTIFL